LQSHETSKPRKRAKPNPSVLWRGGHRPKLGKRRGGGNGGAKKKIGQEGGRGSGEKGVGLRNIHRRCGAMTKEEAKKLPV